MKKNIGIRSALFTLLIIASIASYIYLNMVDVVAEHATPAPLQQTMDQEQASHEVLLPDVELVKKVVEKGLNLIPNS